MAENITAEDLNAVRQQIRYNSALGKMEPILQKVLVAEEQALQFEKEKQAAIAERDRARAEIETERETHRFELQAERERQHTELQAAAEATRKQLDDEIALKENELTERRKLAQSLSERIEELRAQEAALREAVSKLAATRDVYKAEIAATLEKFNRFSAEG